MIQADTDAPVPYWPRYLPTAKSEAAKAVQYWLTPAAEAALEQELEAG